MKKRKLLAPKLLENQIDHNEKRIEKMERVVMWEERFRFEINSGSHKEREII